MKAVIQRVLSASVEVNGSIIGQISQGLVVLLGAAKEDDLDDVQFMVDKIPHLRIFSDSSGKMNVSLVEVGGAILLVSQFTLLGDTTKGKRPGFDLAATPDRAKQLYDSLIQQLREKSLYVATGEFGAHMQMNIQNNGPVTFILDSKHRLPLRGMKGETKGK